MPAFRMMSPKRSVRVARSLCRYTAKHVRRPLNFGSVGHTEMPAPMLTNLSRIASERRRNSIDQRLVREGFAQQSAGARLLRPISHLGIVTRGDEDDGEFEMRGTQPGQDVEAGKPRHVHVEDRAIRALRGERGEEGLASRTSTSQSARRSNRPSALSTGNSSSTTATHGSATIVIRRTLAPFHAGRDWSLVQSGTAVPMAGRVSRSCGPEA